MIDQAPLPFRWQYSTWIETGDYDQNGRFANWLVYPFCSLLDRLMRVWPHEHVLTIDMDGRTVYCLWHCGYVRKRTRHGEEGATNA